MHRCRELFSENGKWNLENPHWELREGHELGYEMDTELLDLCYDGTEGYWTSESMDWLIYASHESSLTVAGEWLVAAIKARWPRWKEHLYTTYDFERPQP